MVCLLLERMELSHGFSSIEKKMHRTHTSNQTLLPSRAIIRQINMAKDALFNEKAADISSTNSQNFEEMQKQVEQAQRNARADYNSRPKSSGTHLANRRVQDSSN